MNRDERNCFLSASRVRREAETYPPNIKLEFPMKKRYLVLPALLAGLGVAAANAEDLRVVWPGGSVVIRGVNLKDFTGTDPLQTVVAQNVVVEVTPTEPTPLPVEPMPVDPQADPVPPAPQPEALPPMPMPMPMPKIELREPVAPMPVTPNRSTNIIRNSGNGFGNRIVIDNGPGGGNGVTILDNVRNGIGNRVMINNPGSTIILGTKSMPRATFVWTEKKFSHDLGCTLYWHEKDRSWYRYDALKDVFQMVPLDPFDD